MKKFIVAIIALGLFWVLPCRATDTVTLKSGDVIHGVVLSVSHGEVCLQVPDEADQDSSEMTFQRTDIVALQSDTPGKTAQWAQADAFENLQRYQLAPTSYPVEHYDEVLNNVFRAFLAKYPDSPHTTAVNAAIQAWTAERSQVAKGSFKRNNTWYRGVAAQEMGRESRTAQLLAAGDRDLQAGAYEPAINQYQAALKQHPLPAQLSNSIRDKLNNACHQWHTAVTAKLQAITEELNQAQAQVPALQQQRDQSNQDFVNTEAHVQRMQQRWTPFFGPPNAEIKLVFQALPGLGFLCVCSAFTALHHGATPASSP
jgi:tetratricopeptide (TPR) repeat protein